jgi:hypothetical protein
MADQQPKFPKTKMPTPARGPASPAPPSAAPQAAKRPTEEEEQEREDYVYELLCNRQLKSQIKARFRKKFGEVHWKTIENYLARARARIAQEVAKGKELMRAESWALYDSIARNAGAADRDRLLAQERIDRLYGLDAPTKTALTDPSGEHSFAELSDAEVNAKFFAALATAAAKLGQPNVGATAVEHEQGDAGNAPARSRPPFGRRVAQKKHRPARAQKK